jgi:hypothetical protein
VLFRHGGLEQWPLDITYIPRPRRERQGKKLMYTPRNTNPHIEVMWSGSIL